MMRSLSIAVGCCIMLFGCDALNPPPRALGTLERDRIELSADSDEPIRELRVAEGDRVNVDDVLVVQERSLLRARLAAANAALRESRARFDEANAGPRAEVIAQARARLDAARSNERTALAELDRSRSLVAQRLVSDNTLDIQQGRYDEAVARRVEANDALRELLEGTRDEQLDQAQGAYEAAVAFADEARLRVDRASIVAPVAGIVEALPFEVGERPPAGAIVAAVLANGRIYARIYVPQAVRNQLVVGAAARITIDGYDEPLGGRLRWVSAEAAFTPFFALTRHDRGRLSYLAEVDVIDESARDLPTGIAVEVEFEESAP